MLKEMQECTFTP